MVTERGTSANRTQNGAMARYENRFGTPSYQTSGNTAHKLHVDAVPVTEQAAPKQRKALPAPAVKTTLSTGSKAMLVLLVVVVFAMGCVMLNRQTIIVENGKQIASFKEQVRQEEKRAQDLKLEMASATDINHIMSEASARLGMGYPQEGQIRAFTLPRPVPNVVQSSAMQEAAPAPEQRLGFLGAILGMLR